jgi:hypothetical protein
LVVLCWWGDHTTTTKITPPRSHHQDHTTKITPP